MNITEHALKRLDLILSNPYAQQEVRFMHKFLLPGAYTINWFLGIQVRDVMLFSERCERFGVRFLGLETHLESPYPLFVYSFEDFGPKYNAEWIPETIRQLEIENITQNIVPTISVPSELINQYLF